MANDVECTIMIPTNIVLEIAKRPMTEFCASEKGRYSDCTPHDFCLHKILQGVRNEYCSDGYRVGSYVFKHDRIRFWAANSLSHHFFEDLTQQFPNLDIHGGFFDDCGFGGVLVNYTGGELVGSKEIHGEEGHLEYLHLLAQADIEQYIESRVSPPEDLLKELLGDKDALYLFFSEFEEGEDDEIADKTVVFKILCHSSKLYKKGMTYYDRNRI